MRSIRHARNQFDHLPFLMLMTADSGAPGDGSAGGTGDGTNPPEAPTGDEGKSGDTPPAGDEKPPANETPEAKVARLETENARLRRENASKRTEAKAQAAQEAADAAKAEIAQQIGKLFGFVKNDEPIDPAQLAQELTAERTRTNELTVELAVFKAASAANADAAKLLDSRSFVATLKDLDPAAKGFEKDLSDKIADAVKNNPAFQAGQESPGRSGGDLNGGTGEGAITQEQFNAMKPAEKNHLFQTNPTLYRQLSGTSG